MIEIRMIIAIFIFIVGLVIFVGGIIGYYKSKKQIQKIDAEILSLYSELNKTHKISRRKK